MQRIAAVPYRRLGKPIFVPKRRCVISQRNAVVICFAVEAWNRPQCTLHLILFAKNLWNFMWLVRSLILGGFIQCHSDLTPPRFVHPYTKMQMSVEHCCNYTDRENRKYWENLPQYQFVDLKSRTDWAGFEPGRPRCDRPETPPEPL